MLCAEGALFRLPIAKILSIVSAAIFHFSLGGTARAADLLILASSDGEFVRDCTNRDVVISASNSKFVLAGGCQSLSVPGHANQILADMAAGSEIQVRGDENNIALINGGSHDPTISAEGRQNQVVKLIHVSVKSDASGSAAASASGETSLAPPRKPSLALPADRGGEDPLRLAIARNAAATKSNEEISRDLETKKVLMVNGRDSELSELPNQLLFAVNSTRLRSEAINSLAEYAELIRRNHSKNIHIIGHTDSIGRFWYNMELSRRRAQSVKTWLVREGGLAKDGLTAIGLGPQSPKASNATSSGRSQNRRVELLREICDQTACKMNGSGADRTPE
jgi:outer membrane protein OmpA-like peptidoglycan-associated protein